MPISFRLEVGIVLVTQPVTSSLVARHTGFDQRETTTHMEREMANPYVSPSGEQKRTTSNSKVVAIAVLLWPLMLLLNVAMPAFVGWPMYRETGLTGVATALVLILVAGWIVGISRPDVARSAFVGLAFVTISQVIPILQVAVGLFTCWLCESTGLMMNPPDKRGFSFVLTSEAAGFVATMFSALSMAAVVGAISTVANLLRDSLSQADASRH